MIANMHYGYGSKHKTPKFTYTGNYKVRDDGVVELLTSGTIVFLEPKVIDLFMVGGGAGGGSGRYNNNRGLGGGGGGYTRTCRKIAVQPNNAYAVTVGTGGIAAQDGSSATDGGSTAFNEFIVQGGKGLYYETSTATKSGNGGSGGSGGGGGVYSNSGYGAGGSDGNTGETGYPTDTAGGIGQRFTTREFGEPAGKLYAGGGGGGRYMSAQSPIISMGGAGGGGAGGFANSGATITKAPSAGVANTGGGGGGGATTTASGVQGASGGSGIVCFREAQELPELAGTWVLNKRVYPPTQQIVETVSFTSLGLVTEVKEVRVGDGTNTGSGNLYIGISKTVTNPSYSVIYTYDTNTWTNIGSLSSAQWVFPAGATASDEFRSWLASNATKQ